VTVFALESKHLTAEDKPLDVFSMISKLHAEAKKILDQKRLDKVIVPEHKFERFESLLAEKGVTLEKDPFNDSVFFMSGVPVHVNRSGLFESDTLAVLVYSVGSSEYGKRDPKIGIIKDGE
jgi:hypothetical protein